MPHTPAAGESRPTLSIFFTGGTISMTHAAADGSAVPTLRGAAIREAVPGLDALFHLRCTDFDRVPSPHFSMERMLALVHAVSDAIQDGADGVVVTHGTDTLEETAVLLDVTLETDRPVVLVGAMRTRDDLSWDGPVNLYCACRVAGDPRARGMGVMVVMNNTINAASEVTKTYTEAVDTFVSPDVGALGIVDMGQVILYRPPVRRVQVGMVETLARVEIVFCAAGSDGRLVDRAMDDGCDGLVVAALGRGNVPPAMAAAMSRAVAAGVPVVVCSRCWGGRVAPVYGYAGGGARLLEQGAIFAPWHNPQRARVTLAVALAKGYDGPALARLFDSPEPGVRGPTA